MLAFQRRMQDQEARSNCQSLFGMRKIPCDNTIRSRLDGCPCDACNALFPHRLDGRLFVALDGIEFHNSCKIKCDHCSTHHVGKAKTP